MPKRVLLAGLFHETHCFVAEVTGADRIRIRRGAEIEAHEGDGSTFDGFIGVARSEGWDIVPAIALTATPSGPVDDAAFEAFWQEFEMLALRAAAGGVDAVWLSLHGAMVTTSRLDPEGEFLARLRRLPGFADLPVVGVFDLHATFTDQMARHADALVAYRNNPHTDVHAAAALSARLLGRCLGEGVRPRIRHRTAPIVWPPTGTGTADRPMRELNVLARAIEQADPGVWAVNVVGGYAYADTPDTGVSFQIVGTQDADAADRRLDELVSAAIAMAEAGVPEEWGLEAALDAAARNAAPGPAIIVEPADNIGGGAPGDCTTVLRAFLARRLNRACVIIDDGAAVQALSGLAIGEEADVSIGGKGFSGDPGPVALRATLVSRSDGRFTLEDRHSHMAALGVNVDMGPSAVIRHAGVTILLTSRKTAPMDLGQLRSQGIEPASMRYIGVKAAVAHRQAYDKVRGPTYTVSTPGPCASDLTALPYRHIRRPVFPLDRAGGPLPHSGGTR